MSLPGGSGRKRALTGPRVGFDKASDLIPHPHPHPAERKRTARGVSRIPVPCSRSRHGIGRQFASWTLVTLERTTQGLLINSCRRLYRYHGAGTSQGLSPGRTEGHQHARDDHASGS